MGSDKLRDDLLNTLRDRGSMQAAEVVNQLVNSGYRRDAVVYALTDLAANGEVQVSSSRDVSTHGASRGVLAESS